MVMIAPVMTTTKPAPAVDIDIPNIDVETGRTAKFFLIVGEGILRFCDADWQISETKIGQFRKHTVCAAGA